VIKETLGPKQTGTLIQVHHDILLIKKIWYINFVKGNSNSNYVVLSGGEENKVEGKGTVQLLMRGKRLIFRDVYYVPSLQKKFTFH
jgi:hypothetical protein